MSGDNIAQLVYLGTFALVLGAGFLLTSKLKLGQTLQMAAIWALIFIGAVAVVGLWGDIQDDLMANQTRFDDNGTITIPRSFDGHYYMTLDINGQSTDFIVDTGATDIVLNRTDAAAAGLDPANLHFLGRAATANGEVRTAPVRLDTVTIGAHEDTNVPAVVNDGELGQSLLGMGYLQRWGRIEITGGEMRLSR
ncbi:TIGR02281 family clan AA aspartic protease [uncultured Tateyamaria sp.]|uniref:retropepsin-like aspartic protease family protein n=1 Tax=uncultured Tateyamaria sp. TaxID=455651 RepID=UPI00260553FB|nr:TIGR02281 family clan AA aspartic protease [uncultured Tateyamaria sp.]